MAPRRKSLRHLLPAETINAKQPECGIYAENIPGDFCHLTLPLDVVYDGLTMYPWTAFDLTQVGYSMPGQASL